tara:strand:- start:167976 stop:168602 length:627 start_codon:yes stop_codon:yes gene_type:complete
MKLFVVMGLCAFFFGCGPSKERISNKTVQKTKGKNPVQSCPGVCKPDSGQTIIVHLKSKVTKDKRIIYKFFSSEPTLLDSETNLYYVLELYPLSYTQWSRKNGPCRKRPCRKQDRYIFMYTLAEKTGPDEFTWKSTQQWIGTMQPTGPTHHLNDLGSLTITSYSQSEIVASFSTNDSFVDRDTLPVTSMELRYRWHQNVPQSIHEYLR